MTRQTSHIAYDEITENGYLTEKRLLVYQTLYKHGPMTGVELDARLSPEGHRAHYHKRLSELETLGVAYVVPDGRRACRVTGNQAEVWDVTDKLPVKPERAPAKPSRDQIATALAFLSEVLDAMPRRPIPDEYNRLVLWLQAKASPEVGRRKEAPAQRSVETQGPRGDR